MLCLFNTPFTRIVIPSPALSSFRQQVVYEPDDAYTVSMMEGFNDLSSSNDICIVNNIKASSEKGNFFWVSMAFPYSYNFYCTV